MDELKKKLSGRLDLEWESFYNNLAIEIKQ
jgi:hypothetical protein